jgi:DNA-binding transcriptional MerR regulator
VFKIREFSRFTRVSVKMLRHYDEIGLLKPAHVDAATSYRYYTVDQLPRLNRIIALKDLGFGLSEIGALLDDHVSTEAMRGMLRLRRAQIEQQLRDEHARLSQVEARLAQIEHVGASPHHVYDVVVREVPAQRVATLRAVVPDANEIAELFEAVEAHAGAHDARAPASPFTLFHDEDYHDEHADVEVAVPLTMPIPATDRIVVKEMAAVPCMACVIYVGSYDPLVDALNAVMVWLAQNGQRAAGPFREAYLRYSAAPKPNVPVAFLTQRREEWVTELQVPIETREGN